MIKVATAGTFDVIHPGLERFLKEAKNLGDLLLVIVVPDKIVQINKGNEYLNDEITRRNNLKALDYVDQAVIDCLDDGYQKLIDYEPNIFVFGPDQRTKHDRMLVEYFRDLRKRGLKVEYRVCGEKTHSSREMIKEMRNYPASSLYSS